MASPYSLGNRRREKDVAKGIKPTALAIEFRRMVAKVLLDHPRVPKSHPLELRGGTPPNWEPSHELWRVWFGPRDQYRLIYVVVEHERTVYVVTDGRKRGDSTFYDDIFSLAAGVVAPAAPTPAKRRPRKHKKEP